MAKCIADIRKAIDDDDKRLIETIPRKGYRLVASPGAIPVLPKMRYAAITLLALAVGFGLLFAGKNVPSEKGPPVVAVLPFKDLSPESHRGYLSDAISEGIVIDLARFPELTIIAESPSFRFRDRPIDIPSTAAALGADFLLDRSQKFDGATLRITAQLINVDAGANASSDTVDAELGAIFEINQALSRRVAHAVVEKVEDIEFTWRSPNEANAMLRYFKASNRLFDTARQTRCKSIIGGIG